MYAPPGVDSDSSDPETVTPPPSPKHTERPQFSLKHFLPTSPRSFLPRRRSSRAKSLMDVNASVSPIMLERRPPTPPPRKKGVTWGEDEVLGPRKTPKPADDLQVDLADSPPQQSPAEPPSGVGSSSRMQSDTGTSSVRNDIGDEVLVLLRKLIADNAARAEQDAAASANPAANLGELESLMTLPEGSAPSPNKSKSNHKKPAAPVQALAEPEPAATSRSSPEKPKPARKRPSVDTSASIQTDSSASAPNAPQPLRVSNPDPAPTQWSTSPTTAPPGQTVPQVSRPHGLNEGYYIVQSPQASNPHQYYPQIDPHSPSSVLSPSMTWPVLHVASTQPAAPPPAQSAPQAQWPALQGQPPPQPQPLTAPPWPTYQAQQYSQAPISPHNQHTVYYSPPQTAYPAQQPFTAHPYYQSFPPVPQAPPPTYPHPPALQPWQPFYSPYYPPPPNGRPNGDSPWTPLTNPWDGRRESPRESEADKNDRRRQPGAYLEAEGLQLRDMQRKPEHVKEIRPEADAKSQRYEIDRTESTRVKDKEEPELVRDVKEQFDRGPREMSKEKKSAGEISHQSSGPEEGNARSLSKSDNDVDSGRVHRLNEKSKDAPMEKTREAMRARGMTEEQIQAYESKRNLAGTDKAPRKEKELTASDRSPVDPAPNPDAAPKSAARGSEPSPNNGHKDDEASALKLPEDKQMQRMIAAMKAKGMPDDKIQAYVQKHTASKSKDSIKSENPSPPAPIEEQSHVEPDQPSQPTEDERERRWRKMEEAMRAKGMSEEQIADMGKKKPPQLPSEAAPPVPEVERAKPSVVSRVGHEPSALLAEEEKVQEASKHEDAVAAAREDQVEERKWQQMVEKMRAKGACEEQIKAMEKKRALQLASKVRAGESSGERVKEGPNSTPDRNEKDRPGQRTMSGEPDHSGKSHDEEERKWRKMIESMRAKGASEEQIKVMEQKRERNLASEVRARESGGEGVKGGPNLTPDTDEKDWSKLYTMSGEPNPPGKNHDAEERKWRKMVESMRAKGASEEQIIAMEKKRERQMASEAQARGLGEDRASEATERPPDRDGKHKPEPRDSSGKADHPAKCHDDEERKWRKMLESMRAKGASEEQIKAMEKKRALQLASTRTSPETAHGSSINASKSHSKPDPAEAEHPKGESNSGKTLNDLSSGADEEERKWRKMVEAMRAKGASEEQIKAMQKKRALQLASGPKSARTDEDSNIKAAEHPKRQPKSGEPGKADPGKEQEEEEEKWRKMVESMRAKGASEDQIKAMEKKRALQLATAGSSPESRPSRTANPRDREDSEATKQKKGKGRDREIPGESVSETDGVTKKKDEDIRRLRKTLQAKGMPEEEIQKYLQKHACSNSSEKDPSPAKSEASSEEEYRRRKAREMMRAKGMTDEQILAYERSRQGGSPRQARASEQPEDGPSRLERDRKGKMRAELPPDPPSPVIPTNDINAPQGTASGRDPLGPNPRESQSLLTKAAEKAEKEREQGQVFVEGERPLKMPGQYVMADAGGSGEVAPVEQKIDKSDEPLTWSRCLVSLATCIDLANHVLADYMSSDKSKRHSQQSSVLLTAVPRLLTSLLMQRDLVAGMSSILGEEQARALREFMQHLGVVQEFLKEAQAGKTQALEQSGPGGVRDLALEATSALETGSLQALFGHLLGLSELLTPNMMAAVRDFIASWHRDGFSVALVIRTIRNVKAELDQVHREKEAKTKEDEGQRRLAQKSEGVMSILDQLLALINPHPGAVEGKLATAPPALPAVASGSAEKEEESAKKLPAGLSPEGKVPNPEGKQRVSSASRDGPQPEKSHRRLSDGIDKLRQTMQAAIHPHDTTRRVSTTPPSSPPTKKPVGRPKTDPRLEITRQDGQRRPTSRVPSGKKRNDQIAIFQIHLPTTTEEFLHRDAATHSAHHDWSPLRPQRRLSDLPEGEIRPDSRRGRRVSDSSASVYSQDSAPKTDDSDSGSESSGTVESDEEAAELLAQADSGPQPVQLERDERSHRKRRPSREEVWAAEDLMGKAKPHKIR